MCLFSDEELILQFSQKYWEPIMFCLQFGQIQSFIFYYKSKYQQVDLLLWNQQQSEDP